MVRPFAILLVAGALTIGSLVEPRDDRSRLIVDGYSVLTADLHVHAFPGDGVLPAWELRREAARRGLDVIAITNHNQSIAARLPTGGGGRLPLVIPGQEITTPTFHLVAIGIRRPIDWRLPLRAAIAAVHDAGGVAIAAHPVKTFWRVDEDDSGLDVLDGAEAVAESGARFDSRRREIREFYDSIRRRNPDLAPIGSSDFHLIVPLGVCRTYVFVREVSERGVLEAIAHGRTVAIDDGNQIVGDSTLVRQLHGLPEAPGTPALPARLAALAALLGLGLIVCLR